MSKKRANKKSGKEGKRDCPNTNNKEQKEHSVLNPNVNQNNIVEGESKSEKLNWMFGGVLFGMSGSVMANFLSSMPEENWCPLGKLLFSLAISAYFFFLAILLINNKTKRFYHIYELTVCISIALFFIVFIFLLRASCNR